MTILVDPLNIKLFILLFNVNHNKPHKGIKTGKSRFFLLLIFSSSVIGVSSQNFYFHEEERASPRHKRQRNTLHEHHIAHTTLERLLAGRYLHSTKMSALEEGNDAFEVQVHDWDEHKLDQVSVIRTKRTVEDTRLRLLVLVKSPAYNDESTAPTDASTDIDDASLLREFSFGSLSLNDAGRDVVQSHYEHDNNDNATTYVDDAKQQSHSWRVHSFNQQSNIVDSIGESNGSSSLLDQNCDFQDKSLFDVDLDDDDPNVSNTSILGIQLASHDPSSSTTNQRSSKKQFRFDDISSSSKSLLLTGTRNTESYNFYRVSTYSQDNEEPLSCQQKLVQVSEYIYHLF